MFELLLSPGYKVGSFVYFPLRQTMLSRKWCWLDAAAVLLGALSTALVRAFTPSRPMGRTILVTSHRYLQQPFEVVRLHDRDQQRVVALQMKRSQPDITGARQESMSSGSQRRRRTDTSATRSPRRATSIEPHGPNARRLQSSTAVDVQPEVVTESSITSVPSGLKEVVHSQYLTLFKAAMKRHEELMEGTTKQSSRKRSRKDSSPFALAGEGHAPKNGTRVTSPAESAGTDFATEAQPLGTSVDTVLVTDAKAVEVTVNATSSQSQTKRRSKYFWSDPSNTRKEVATFWEQLGVTSDKVWIMCWV